MYLALYRKYRPRVFRDVVSQEHITTTLQNQIKSGQFAHAYLFTGTRGTGKTTCAKILSKAVNCLSPTADGNPCGECEACKKIDDGSTDIIEIDAASNNGVDDVRILRDEIVYTPIDVKYKVYIIDEVHMLSISAFNALLKTIEEPPSHVIFILATTDVHKIPATILSRCQRYQFRKIDPNDCVELLLEVAQKEGVTLEKTAAQLIARLSEGAMRDAYSLLDQCISVSKSVTEEVVRESCGVAGNEQLFEICEAVLYSNCASALRVLNELIESSKDMGKLVEELIQHYRNLMLLKLTPKNPVVRATDTELADYERLLEGYSLEMIMRCLDLLTASLDKINRMKQTGQARLLAEMLIVSLCTPKLDSDTKALSLRIDSLEQRINSGNIPVAKSAPPVPEKPQVSAEQPKPAVEKPQVAVEQPEPVIEQAPPVEMSEPAPIFDEPEAPPVFDEPPLPEAPPVPDEPQAVLEATTQNAPQEATKAQSVERILPNPGAKGPIGISPLLQSEIPQSDKFFRWDDVLKALPMTLAGFLEGAEAFVHDDAFIVCVTPAAQEILTNPERAEKLRSAVYGVMGSEIPVLMCKEEEKEEERSKLDSFLDFAKQSGIAVKMSDN